MVLKCVKYKIQIQLYLLDLCEECSCAVIHTSYNSSLKMTTKMTETCRRFMKFILY